MTDAIHEQLSAFVDGELSAAESELLLKRVERDTQLRGRVGRNVLIGEALRATRAQGPSRDFAAKVAAAIEHEATPVAVRLRAMQWLKPIAGGAIAAGVAAIALVALQPSPNTGVNSGDAALTASVSLKQSETPSADQSMENVSMVAETANAVASHAPTTYVVPLPGVDRPAPPVQFINSARLANYVVAHSEYSSPLGRRNVLTGLLTEATGNLDDNLDELNPSDIDQSAIVPVPAIVKGSMSQSPERNRSERNSSRNSANVSKNNRH